MTQTMTPEAEKVLDTIAKLLALADRAGTPEEAANAAGKAQALMEKHSLSTAMLERRSGESGRRTQELLAGGFYQYQRDVWGEVARLNFCLHWVRRQRIEMKGIRRKNKREDVEWGDAPPTRKFDGEIMQRVHAIVGRVANVKTTIAVANYLLGSIERITREVCAEKRIDLRSKWASSFRDGCAYEITTRLWARRNDAIATEEKKKREAFERAAKSGVSTSTALTLSTLAEAERDANWDFLQGNELGTNARERAERAAAKREREEEYTRWAAANPEEARAKEAKEQAERDKRANRASSDRYGNRDHQAFWEGHKRAAKIGLDPQADHAGKSTKRIGRSR